MIRIEEDLTKKAKELGLNISKISENVLKEMVRRIEQPDQSKQSEDCPNNSKYGGREGIRTPVTGSGGLRPILARHRENIFQFFTRPPPPLKQYLSSHLTIVANIFSEFNYISYDSLFLKSMLFSLLLYRIVFP